jgi:hypothetical protein
MESSPCARIRCDSEPARTTRNYAKSYIAIILFLSKSYSLSYTIGFMHVSRFQKRNSPMRLFAKSPTDAQPDRGALRSRKMTAHRVTLVNLRHCAPRLTRALKCQL